jgi:uncharacterized membrane protein
MKAQAPTEKSMTTKKTLKTYFLTGLLVLVPLAITLWVLGLVIGTMDQTLQLLPESWQPDTWLGVHVPGIGAVLTLAFIFVVGLLTQNFIGQTLVKWWDWLLRHIPIVGPLYTSIKQVSDTLLSSSGNAFRKALLIEYPRKGSYTIAFLTGVPGGDVAEQLNGDHVSVYVPTTPNPTSGFFLIVPRAEVVELDMSVDAALKYIVSMGVVSPVSPPRRVPEPAVVVAAVAAVKTKPDGKSDVAATDYPNGTPGDIVAGEDAAGTNHATRGG